MMETMEMESTKKIGFVCFISTFIGAGGTLATALQFALGWWLAPIGAVVFSAFAYLGYEWRAVGRAAIHAWRAAVRWRPDKDSWFWYGISLSGGILVPLLLLAILVWGFLPPDSWFVDPEIFENPQNSAVFLLIFFGFAIPASAGIVVTIGCHDRSRVIQSKLAGDKYYPFTNWRQQALYINPLTAPIIAVLLYLAVPLGLIVGAGWSVFKIAPRVAGTLRTAPRVTTRAFVTTVRALTTFVVVFFHYLHSEERRICLTATAVGVLVGFAIGYPRELVLLGAIAGGLMGSALGVAEYRLARWLRLVPTPVKAG